MGQGKGKGKGNGKGTKGISHPARVPRRGPLLRRSTLALVVLASLLALPLAAAEEGLELYPAPKTDVARSVQSLFNATFVIAMIVFVGVEGFLFFTIRKFRRNKIVPANEEHRGHVQAEI